MFTTAVLNSALLDVIEAAARAMLTLTSGVEEADFAKSRLAMPAVRRYVAMLVETAGNLPAMTRTMLDRVDWDAWLTVARDARQGGDAEARALWFGAHSLAPATVRWLGTYRRYLPELFLPRHLGT